MPLLPNKNIKLISAVVLMSFFIQQVSFAESYLQVMRSGTGAFGRTEAVPIARKDRVGARLAGEVPLDHLVAYLVNPLNADLSTLKQAITDSPKTIPQVLKNNPGDRGYQEAVMGDFVHAVFAEKHRPIVEIVSNAVDAAMSSQTGERSVDVRINPSGFEVTDPGIGMNLDDILLKLLIPMITGKEGFSTHGRFGVGFFSVLSYLKRSDDELIVRTTQGSTGHELRFYLKNGKIYVVITPKQNLPQGTSVQLISNGFEMAKAEILLKDTFRALDGVSIRINQTVINHPEDYVPILGNPRDGRGSIRVSRQLGQGKGKILVSVRGVTFFEIPLEGQNVPEAFLVDFPATIPFPVSRNTFEVTEATRKTMKQFIKGLELRKDNLERLSQIQPLVEYIDRRNPKRNVDGQNLTEFLKNTARALERQDNDLLIPLDVQSNSIDINYRNIRFVRSEFITDGDREKLTPLKLPDYRSQSHVYLVDFKDPESLKIIFSADKHYVFINKKYFDGSPLNAAHWTLLFQKHGIFGDFSWEEEKRSVASDEIPTETSEAFAESSVSTPTLVDLESLPVSADEAYAILRSHPMWGRSIEKSERIRMAYSEEEFLRIHGYSFSENAFKKYSSIFGYEFLFRLMLGLLDELGKYDTPDLSYVPYHSVF